MFLFINLQQSLKISFTLFSFIIRMQIKYISAFIFLFSLLYIVTDWCQEKINCISCSKVSRFSFSFIFIGGCQKIFDDFSCSTVISLVDFEIKERILSLIIAIMKGEVKRKLGFVPFIIENFLLWKYLQQLKSCFKSISSQL